MSSMDEPVTDSPQNYISLYSFPLHQNYIRQNQRQ